MVFGKELVWVFWGVRELSWLVKLGFREGIWMLWGVLYLIDLINCLDL